MRIIAIDINHSDLILSPLDWQKRGIIKYPNGGEKVPTEFMFKFKGKLKRVYQRITFDYGTRFILNEGHKIILNIAY